MKTRSLAEARAALEAAPGVVADPPVPESVPDAETIAQLAALPPLEYDRRREAAARRLGVRVATLDAEVRKARSDAADDASGGRALKLDDPEPWPEPVEAGELLDEIETFAGRYLVLPEGGAAALALWALHTWAHEAATISPVLAITSPEKRCGKTTALTVLGEIVRRPLFAANVTAAALFRSTEMWQPTLLVDEADTFLRDSDELRGILNSGHNRSAAFVVRTVGENHEPHQFTTWSPKAIALIGKLPGTLADRSIHLRLRRALASEPRKRLRLDRLEAGDLRRRCARWAADSIGALRLADPPVPPGFNDRAADNWRPLLAIADSAGERWANTARAAAVALADPEDEAAATGVMLLADIRKIMGERDRITSAELVERLADLEDRPWPEWRGGKPISARQVARLLAPFGVKPRAARFEGHKPGSRGYLDADLVDAWARYLPLPPDPSATPQHSLRNNELREYRSATPDAPVADRDRRKPAPDGHCCGVADRSPPEGWRGEL